MQQEVPSYKTRNLLSLQSGLQFSNIPSHLRREFVDVGYKFPLKPTSVETCLLAGSCWNDM